MRLCTRMTVVAVLGGVCASASVAQAQTTHEVNLSGTSFTPRDTTIQVGDTVRWIWVDMTHNVVSGVIEAGVGVPDDNFRSGDPVLGPGPTFELTFDQAFLDAKSMPDDVYPYYCIVHVGFDMAGSITVEGGVEAVPTVSGWGFVVLASVMVGAGALIVRRRMQGRGRAMGTD